MKEEQLIKGNGIKSQIGKLDYDSCALRKLLEEGETALLSGIINKEIGRKAIIEQLDANEQWILKLQKEFDEL